jgi:hypothetical protein
MVSTILTFALAVNICLVSAAPISRRSLEKRHIFLIAYIGSMIAVAALWFGGWTLYDKVKASNAAKLKAKSQANQNSDLEAGLSTELVNVQAPEPAKMKGSTSQVCSPTKKFKTQNLHADVRSGPAKMKGSDPKKPKTQNLRADVQSGPAKTRDFNQRKPKTQNSRTGVQSGPGTNQESGRSGALNHFLSGSTLRDDYVRPPANIENS